MIIIPDKPSIATHKKNQFSVPDEVLPGKYQQSDVRKTETGFGGMDLDELDDCPVPAMKAPKSQKGAMFAFADDSDDDEDDSQNDQEEETKSDNKNLDDDDIVF